MRVVRNVPLPRKRPLPAAGGLRARKCGRARAPTVIPATFTPVPPARRPFAVAPSTADPARRHRGGETGDRGCPQGQGGDADAAEKSIRDPVARKLAEWVILRSDNTNPTSQRYAAFVNANPNWPHTALFRRRAENALWNDGVQRRHGACLFRRP